MHKTQSFGSNQHSLSKTIDTRSFFRYIIKGVSQIVREEIHAQNASFWDTFSGKIWVDVIPYIF